MKTKITSKDEREIKLCKVAFERELDFCPLERKVCCKYCYFGYWCGVRCLDVDPNHICSWELTKGSKRAEHVKTKDYEACNYVRHKQNRDELTESGLSPMQKRLRRELQTWKAIK